MARMDMLMAIILPFSQEVAEGGNSTTVQVQDPEAVEEDFIGVVEGEDFEEEAVQEGEAWKGIPSWAVEGGEVCLLPLLL
jgi:hypothetical protein